MKIILTECFQENLDEILIFISKDSVNRALKFRDDLYTEIHKISFMPFAYRENCTEHNYYVRDLIFKKYVVPFKIEADTIKILAIYKKNLWKKNNNGEQNS